MKGINIDKIDKELRASDAKSKIKILKQINFTSFIKEFLIDNHKGFEKLLRLYEKLEPNWVKIYNREEEKKPDNIQTFLENNISIEDVINEASGDEIMELALTTVVANRVSHYISNTLKRKVEIYKNNNNVDLNKEEFGEVYKNIIRYFDPSNKGKKDTLNYITTKLNLYDIDVSKFDREEMETLIESQNTTFALKDHAIFKMLGALRERDDINYGYKIDEKGKDMFVMDLPYYGQFSVHLKKPKLSNQYTRNNERGYDTGKIKNDNENNNDINNVRKSIFTLLKNIPYDQDIYEKKNIMLTSNISSKGEEFLINLRKLNSDEDKIEKIKEIGKDYPRYSHYLMVKSGYDTRGDENESRTK